ncbi:serine protease 27-like protein [Labeo rohita]|uniref:Serine protease 27-like protein n=1 Tax=Labeo rohita TaxID=84645 RepID=A0A498P0N5_LABRO|nr:serine protease 27-like protein [Labeo rohita]
MCHLSCLCQLDVCGRAPLNDRISGGENATAGVWPWQVSIHDIQLGHHYCGGTLIAKDWVLAGAHCFDRTVSRVIVHPDYGHPPFDKDIALVQLSSSVPFSDYIRPVCLAAAGSVFDAGTESWVTGWGYLQPEGPVSDMLQEVMLPVVSNSDCDHAYTGVVGITITNNMICSGQDGKSVCPRNVCQYRETLEVQWRIPTRNQMYALGVVTLFLSLKDPFSKKGYEHFYDADSGTGYIAWRLKTLQMNAKKRNKPSISKRISYQPSTTSSERKTAMLAVGRNCDQFEHFYVALDKNLITWTYLLRTNAYEIVLSVITILT